MKQQLNTLIDKKTFLIRLSKKIGVDRETLRGYFESDKLPLKHKERILKAIEVQLKEDEITRNREVIAWESV
jgi:hypothetical protein